MNSLQLRASLCLILAFALLAAHSLAATWEFRAEVIDVKTGRVADAVVSLVRLDAVASTAAPTVPGASTSPLDAAARTTPAASPLEIVQENQEFRPYVTAVRVGTPIVFPNRDTVQHHVYSGSKSKNFELPLYDPGKAETVVFDRPGPVVIGCNIHDWMSAHVLVLETPFFAKTDAEGVAVIVAPAGRYRAEVWHPRLAKMATREITLGENTAAPVEFILTLKAPSRIQRGPAVKGGGYR